jgi:hypothetical protein
MVSLFKQVQNVFEIQEFFDRYAFDTILKKLLSLNGILYCLCKFSRKITLVKFNQQFSQKFKGFYFSFY